MSQSYSILLILLFPVLGGIIGFYLGKRKKETRNDWIDIVVVVELAMLVYMGYLIIGKKVEISMTLGSLMGLGLSFTLDTTRLVFCTVATVLFGVVFQFMKESMKEEAGSNRFYLFYMCTYSMILSAFITDNLFNFYLFVVLALLCVYPLILHRQDKMAIKSARIYMAFLVAALVLMMTGIVIVYAALGSVSYTEMYSFLRINGISGAGVLGGFIIFAGFMIIAGIFPVQFQVTRGCSYSMLEISAVLSCLLSKLGIFGMMILTACLFPSITLYGRLLLAVGTLTTIWGLLITLSSTDIRKILMGLNIVTNGFNTLSIALMALSAKSNGYAVRSSVLVLMVSSLSLFVLYMAALELVRKVHTYEINGLIASGKKNKLLTVVCFLASASLAGVPGTAGFLAHSMLFNTITIKIGWKWLTVVYVLLWAFFMTAVVRVFMKLFISQKEKTLRILTTEEEAKTAVDRSKADRAVLEDTKEDLPEDRKKIKKAARNPYFSGEVMLLGIGIIQVVVGIFPDFIFDSFGNTIVTFFHGDPVTGTIPYFAGDVFIGFGIAVVLCIVFYLNLVHGILLRAIRNKKNKKLQENL